MFCIPKELVEQFKAKLKSGEITPEKLVDMTSKERHQFLGETLGESNARSVNALFESKLLLKNQQLGIINWAKKIAGLKPEVLRDMISKVNRMDKVLDPKEMDAFLEDLASQRLGFDVTFEEAAQISHLAKDVAEKKGKITEDMPDGHPSRIDYGTSLVLFKDFVGKLKLEAKEIKTSELWKNPGEFFKRAGSLFKSLKATADNSFFGRQGQKVFYTNPTVWAKNFLKSFGDIGKELLGIDATAPIKADVLSRKNALDGNYERMGLDIGIKGEEAFPSSLPGRIPALGRLFKASESAYNGAALRFRADLADIAIETARHQGVDIMDKTWAKEMGQQINSYTGRGSVSRYLTAEGQAKANALLFSVKFLKAQFDVLLKPFDLRSSPYVRKQAAYKLAKILTGVTAINALVSMLNNETPEFDPRSTNFERPRVPGTESHFDISGGITSLMTLGSRVLWTKHDGEWGHWMKNQNGKWTKLNAGAFGQQTGWDVLIDGLFSNKLDPLFALLRDDLRGSTFEGEPVNASTAITSLLAPIPLMTSQKIKKSEDAGKWLWLMLLEEFGYSVSIPRPQKPKPLKF